MATKFRQVAARLTAVRNQLAVLQGEAHAANSKIQAAALKAVLDGMPQDALSYEQRFWLLWLRAILDLGRFEGLSSRNSSATTTTTPL
jgi:hypothetical protein